MIRSHWYIRATKALAKALDGLPPDADRKAINLAAQAAYPFGKRLCWPYKKWCEAKRDYLHMRWPAMFKARKKKPRKEPQRTGEVVTGAGLFETQEAGHAA